MRNIGGVALAWVVALVILNNANEAHKVTLYLDGKEKVVQKGGTILVRDILVKEGVFLNEGDKLYPSADSRLKDGMVVVLQRADNPIYASRAAKEGIKIAKAGEALIEVTKSIPFEKVEKPSTDIPKGKVVLTEQGAPGTLVEHFKLVMWKGREIRRELVRRNVLKKPSPAVYLIGRGVLPSYRGERRAAIPAAPKGGTLKIMEATGYWPWVNGTGITKNGMRARRGVVAVDPRVIPLGTQLYVEGYGYAIAADTGSAIKGSRIDLCFSTRAEAIRFGRRRVVVRVL